jgi:hypothetical protein
MNTKTVPDSLDWSASEQAQGISFQLESQLELVWMSNKFEMIGWKIGQASFEPEYSWSFIAMVVQMG